MLGFQWHNREFYKNGDQHGKKKTIFPYITGKKSMHWGGDKKTHG